MEIVRARLADRKKKAGPAACPIAYFFLIVLWTSFWNPLGTSGMPDGKASRSATFPKAMVRGSSWPTSWGRWITK